MIDRRQAMLQMALGTAGLCLPRPTAASQVLEPIRLADLAQQIRDTPRAKILEFAANSSRFGTGPSTLLGATFLAGVHDVRPRPVGDNLHSVMSIEASFRLIEKTRSAEEAWLIALWNVDAFKKTQHERDEEWVLPAAPKVSFNSEAAARRELIAALDSWDEERADRAIVGLLPHHNRQSLYEILWPYTARCLAYLGHKVVYGAMSEAVLRRISWAHAEPTVRSLVYGLIGRGRGDTLTRASEHTTTLVDKFPSGWSEARQAPPVESEAILRKLLAGDYRQAQGTVIEASRSGTSPGPIWDAIRLAAAELWLRRTSNDPNSGAAIRAAHAVTEVWSLGHAFRAARVDRHRRILLLQAAAWIPELRDVLVEREAISMDGPGILDLGENTTEIPTLLDELVEHGDPAAARAFLDRHPQQQETFRGQMRGQLAAKGIEYHQFKYAVAIEDESLPAHPHWASRLLAPAVGYLPTHKSADNELADRSRHALRKARVIG